MEPRSPSLTKVLTEPGIANELSRAESVMALVGEFSGSVAVSKYGLIFDQCVRQIELVSGVLREDVDPQIRYESGEGKVRHG